MCPVDFGKQLHLKHMFYETNMWRNLGPSQVNSNFKINILILISSLFAGLQWHGYPSWTFNTSMPIFQNIPWPYLPNYFTCNADPTILCFYCPFCSILPPSVPILRIANNLSCLLFISFISMMKYILEIKPTGDQDSAASNCFNVGGCMIRVVCFTQNLYSKRKKMELERLTRATKLCWSCLGSTKHETDPHPLVHFDTNY